MVARAVGRRARHLRRSREPLSRERRDRSARRLVHLDARVRLRPAASGTDAAWPRALLQPSRLSAHARGARCRARCGRSRPTRCAAAGGRARAFSAQPANAARHLRAALSDQVRGRARRRAGTARRAPRASTLAFIASRAATRSTATRTRCRLLDDGRCCASRSCTFRARASASSSSPVSRGRDGLSVLGRDYVRAAQRTGASSSISRTSTGAASSTRSRCTTAASPCSSRTPASSGVHANWRNLDDAQLRAVADTGGMIGVMYHGGYLGGSYWSGRQCRARSSITSRTS